MGVSQIKEISKNLKKKKFVLKKNVSIIKDASLVTQKSTKQMLKIVLYL